MEGQQACLYVNEGADFGSARDVILTALIVGLWQIGEALTGEQLEGSMALAFAEPSYAARFGKLVMPVRYGQARNALLFRAALLDTPLAMANPAALRLAQEQCERALDALDQADLLGRVQSALPRKEGGFHSLEQVAATLGVSSRTLKRKLKAEGAVFSAIVEPLAQAQAVALLGSSELSVEQVAERVGYSDVSNFGRAFRRWTGTTPAAHRTSLLRGAARLDRPLQPGPAKNQK